MQKLTGKNTDVSLTPPTRFLITRILELDLGKTATMCQLENNCSNAMIYISYWKSLDHLYRFANGAVHTKGSSWS